MSAPRHFLVPWFEYITEEYGRGNCDYPSCCSVACFTDFPLTGGYGPKTISDKIKVEIAIDLKEHIILFKEQGHCTFISIVIIRDQEYLVPILEDLGFYSSPNWMAKGSRGETEKPAGNDTKIFFLPLGSEIE